MNDVLAALLTVSILATGVSAQRSVPRTSEPTGSARIPVDVSAEGLEHGSRRAPGAVARGGSAEPSARRTGRANTPSDCLESIADQATGACLFASSTPTLGVLHPYPGLDNVFVPQAFVGGGENNQATVPWSTVAGGRDNTASGDSATIAGGGVNTAAGRAATVAGGGANTASSDFDTVGGGLDNTASGSASTVGGGLGNTAFGSQSTIGGGYNNTAANVGTVGGGSSNVASHAGSDRDAKENLEPVDARAVLDKVAGLAVATWNYKAQDDSIRHRDRWRRTSMRPSGWGWGTGPSTPSTRTGSRWRPSRG